MAIPELVRTHLVVGLTSNLIAVRVAIRLYELSPGLEMPATGMERATPVDS